MLTDSRSFQRPGRTRIGLAFLLLAFPLLAGCRSELVTTAPSSPAARPTADELLEQVVRAYRGARSYRDRGTVTLSYVNGGQRVEDRADVSVVMQRPHQVRVRAYQAQIVSNGQRLQALIDDPGTQRLDGQVLDRPAPERLTLRDLLADPLLRDQLGNAVIDPAVGREPLQLELLFADEPLELSSARDVRRRLGDDARIDGVDCYRLELETARGQFVFWVDQRSFVLRRVEYPREALISELAKAKELQNVRLVADFVGAEFDGPVTDEDFAWQPPQDAKLVRFFVPPPQPLPSPLFGRNPGPFRLHAFDASKVTHESIAGRYAALLWFHDHPTCELAVRQLQAFADALPESSDVACYAVCTEPSAVSDAQIRQLAQRWELALPVVRDRDAQGRDVFHIDGAPTLVVLDPQGRVQIVEVGANPNLARELPGVFERLRKGDDLAGEIRQQHDEQQARYQSQLALATGSRPITATPQSAPTVAPASTPKRLKLQRLWVNTELTAAGNLLVVNDSTSSAGPVANTGRPVIRPISTAASTTSHSAGPTVLAWDGTRTIVELDMEGRATSRHELNLPEQARGGRLRTAVDRGGRRYFAVSDWQAAQCYVFDGNWNRLAEYPPATEQAGNSIRDFQLADFDGDGRVELAVALAGNGGLHFVSTDGRRLYGDRSFAPAMSLALGEADAQGARTLLTSGDQGEVQSLSGLKPSSGAVDVAGWSVHQLFDARYPLPGKQLTVALAENRDGRPAVVAFDTQWREQWNYPMAGWMARGSVERVSSGLLLDERRGCWVAAGADGSVHVITEDAQFSDYFATGSAIHGLAVARVQSRGLLWVASPDGVTAWQVDLP